MSAQLLSQVAHTYLRKSGSRLGLKLDPLQLPIADHRQLQVLNENALSDWLAWSLKVACTCSEDPVALCKDILGSKIPYASDVSEREIPKILREPVLEKGREGQSGRADLTIDFPETKKTWLIEAKKGSADAADLSALRGYRETMESRVGHPCDCILLALDHTLDDYHEFVPLKWESLCVNIRRWILAREHRGLLMTQCLCYSVLLLKNTFST